jgi:5'-nucleotidase
VGAALQAAEWRIPALAVSLQTDTRYHFHYGEVDWTAAAHFARQFAERLLRQAMPDDVHVLNVVVPDDATPATPVRITRLARQPYFNTVVEAPTAASRIGDVRFGVMIDPLRLEPDTDIHAIVSDRIVSVTPLSLDLTSRVDRAALGTLLLGDGGEGLTRS